MASPATALGVTVKRLLDTYKELRKQGSRLVPLHLDFGCEMAILQGCQDNATVIGPEVWQPESPQGFL